MMLWINRKFIVCHVRKPETQTALRWETKTRHRKDGGQAYTDKANHFSRGGQYISVYIRIIVKII